MCAGMIPALYDGVEGFFFFTRVTIPAVGGNNAVSSTTAETMLLNA